MFDWTEDELKRLGDPRVNYMEISAVAGGFSCGTCEYLKPDGCGNRLVLAPVSETHGCCNLFEPDEAEKLFPADD